MKTMVYSATVTVFSLFGGLLLGVIGGNVVFESLPGHNFQPLEPMHIILPISFALIGFLTGSAVWGVLMGRVAKAPNRRRMAIAGVLGFAPITAISALGLQAIEPVLLEQFGEIIPIHRLFTLLFVPTAFLIAGVSGWAIGIGLRAPTLARSMFLRVGFAGAITFLIINLGMELAGWVVGAPGAEQRFTMLTVMFIGNLGAAIVGGAFMGHMLAANTVTQQQMSAA